MNMDIELKDFLEALETFLTNYLKDRDRKVAGDILAIFQRHHGNPPESEDFQQEIARKYNSP
jgi:hypothetical protein